MKMSFELDKIFRTMRTVTPSDVRDGDLSSSVRSDLSHLCTLFPELNSEQKKLVFEQADSKLSFLFFIYASQMAVQAVRKNDVALLRQGLIAMVIENCNFDWRDSVIRLALLYRSAELLTVDPHEEFHWAKSFALEKMAYRLSQFAARPANLRHLKEFFFKEDRDANGDFVYAYIGPR